MVFVFLCPGPSEDSTSSFSGFKAFQKLGPLLTVSYDRLGEPFDKYYILIDKRNATS